MNHSFKSLRTWAFFVFVAVAVISFSVSANAVTHLVTNTNDSGAGSLRQAFISAMSSANQTEVNYIEFDAAAFSSARTITLNSVIQVSHATGIILNGTGKNLLTITNGLGSGDISFELTSGTLTLSNLRLAGRSGVLASLSNLTLRDMLFDGVFNGQGFVVNTNNAFALNIESSEFVNSNVASINLSNLRGTFNFKNSTIANNLNAGIAAGAGSSTAVHNLENSTIGNNFGVAIYHLGTNGQKINITNCTIANNRGNAPAGGIYHDTAFFASTINLRNTILADNKNGAGAFSDLFGPVNSLGNNLIRATPSGTVSGSTATNILGVSPQLSPTLDFNGGTTRNYALLAGSPAIDAGNNCVVTDNCAAARFEELLAPLLTDQRGANRLIGGNVDIGAFEYAPLTAANGSISGVVKDGNGRGIPRVRITLTDMRGNRRAALTGSFGYYRFEEVETGETYVIEAQSKRYQFRNNPRITAPTEILVDEDFITDTGNTERR